jgi:hypothetical protein
MPSSALLEINRLARALVDTSSLAAAENALRTAGRDSGIDYERRKAEQRRNPRRSSGTPPKPRSPSTSSPTFEPTRERAASTS